MQVLGLLEADAVLGAYAAAHLRHVLEDERLEERVELLVVVGSGDLQVKVAVAWFARRQKNELLV